MRKILDEKTANQYSPLTLAFLGDAVYEQLVRERLVANANRPTRELHPLKTAKVCAEFQAKAIKEIEESLTEKEIMIYKRGRNASGATVPKHSSASDYRYATGLECLFGYLHLIGDFDRIYEIFEMIYNFEIA